MELQESHKRISVEERDNRAFYKELPLMGGKEWRSFSTIEEALVSVIKDDYETYVC